MFTELIKNTVYINLASRPDRCSHIKQELSKLGIISPTRFEAIKNKMGQVGCSMSHIKCLEMSKQENWEHVFICEDDTVFTNPELLMERLSKAQEIPVWDVLIVGGNNQKPFIQTVHTGFIQVHNCQTTTAYIVKKAYYDILIQNIRESLEKLLRNPQQKHLFSIDIYWKKLQIKDTWLMAIPATVSQLDDFSDIEGQPVSYNHLMLDYEKNWLDTHPTLKMPIPNPVVQPSPVPSNQLNQPDLVLSSGWRKGFLRR